MEEKILDKIKKLLKKSESAKDIGSIEEAEAFAAKVQELLAKYNLELSQINTDDEQYGDNVEHEYMKAWHSNIGGNDSLHIMRAIAQFNWCYVYAVGDMKDNKMVILGTPENIEVCKYIHSIVCRIFIDASRAEYKKYVKNEDYIFEGRLKPVTWDTFARAFMKGCAKGLKHKLKSERERFVENNENAYGLVRTNDIVLQNYVETKFKMGKGQRAGKSTDAGNAYGKGYKTGRDVTIHKGVETQSKPIERKQLK